MSFSDDTDPLEPGLFDHLREPGRNEIDEDEQLGPYPDPPTPEAVRVYATRRADLAAEKALRTGDPLDAEIAALWLARIEPAVEDAIALERVTARLAEVDS